MIIVVSAFIAVVRLGSVLVRVRLIGFGSSTPNSGETHITQSTHVHSTFLCLPAVIAWILLVSDRYLS